MEREGQIGRQREGGKHTTTPPEWREYQRTYRQISPADRRRGAREGVWPEGTSQAFIDLYTKSTAEDKLLWFIFGTPSAEEIQEIRQRTPEDLRKLQEEREERGEQLQVRYDAMFPRGIKDEVDQIMEMDGLSPVEANVLKQRFGLEDGRSRTQREIGEQIGRSPRTVGRIERTALQKLRQPST